MDSTRGRAQPNGLFSTGIQPTITNASKAFEEGNPLFYPEPTGPYEQTSTCERLGAQEHYVGREITLRNPRGMAIPCTSYRQHYCPHPVHHKDEPELNFNSGSVPFTSLTEYKKEFIKKPSEPFQNRVVKAEEGPIHDRHSRIQGTTTKQASYQPFTIEPKLCKTATKAVPHEINLESFLKDAFSSTYTQMHCPKQLPNKEHLQEAPLRPLYSMLNASTTYRSEFFHKDPLEPVSPRVRFDSTLSKFDDRTTYKREFAPKDPIPDPLHLTGLKDPDAIQLSLPRRSLGVQYVISGDSSDLFFNLIPRHMDAPCTGNHIFTTTSDNQEQACILIIYGDNPVASENLVLGQFDILNIPPAPKKVPRIEVTFHLDKNLFLTVSARDLDSCRQVEWAQRDIIVRSA